MSERTLKIGTRGSLLAVTQSTWVKERIQARHPQWRIELVRITTKGDKILDVPLAKVGGKGLFVKEIEDALLDGRADIAVHSLTKFLNGHADVVGGIIVCKNKELYDRREELGGTLLEASRAPYGDEELIEILEGVIDEIDYEDEDKQLERDHGKG